MSYTHPPIEATPGFCPRPGVIVLPALAFLFACASGPVEKPQVTPQRPTLSSSTTTTAEGTLELETGVSVDPGERFSLPSTLKWGYSERAEFFLGVTPLEFLDGGQDGFGDLGLGTRARFWESDDSAAALQLFTKLPTASTDLGFSRQLDFFTAGIVDHAFDDDTAGTAYYEIGLLGDSSGGGADFQHLLALALSTNLADDLSLFGEAAGILVSDGGDPLFFTFGLAHTVAPNLVFDGGVRAGLNSDAEDLVFLLGLTTNFGYVSDVGEAD